MKRFSLILILVIALGMFSCCAHAGAVNYTTMLAGAEEIYLGPGYDYGYARNVGEDGTYTIVEEAICEDGYLWGRLKSGAGWVMLERVEMADDGYTVSLGVGEGIWEGPGLDYDYVGGITSDGVFTIVEESTCEDGYLWGKLKSGAGWVILDTVEEEYSYTMSISGDADIYSGPGYDYACVGKVGADGTYTIVEEQIDDDYNVWGKLKSGAGWVFIENDWADTFYTVPLGGWVQIFAAPGYDYSYVGDVGEDGVYTIVAEHLDDEGNYWGQLKSGAGWVNLTEVRTKGNPAISAGYADEKLISEGGYVFYSMHDSEYVTKVVFRAHELLQDVELCLLDYDEYGNYIPAGELYSFDQFFEDTPFVAELLFQGDMTTYGISFTDEAGIERTYALYISGRNGSPVMQEYVY